MAVPGTHDGPVGPRSRSSRLLVLVSAVAAVVIAACLVVLGGQYADTSGATGDRLRTVWGGGNPDAAAERAARTRELVMSQARTFVLRINTFGPDDLDEQQQLTDYVDEVGEVITPKLGVDFEKSVPTAAQQAAREDRTATIYGTGLNEISDDNATVLVSGLVTKLTTGADEPRLEVFRYAVSMVRTQGKWLVDDFDPVTAQSTAPEQEGAEELPGSDSPVVARYAELVGKRSGSIDAAVAVLDGCGFPRPVSSGDADCVGAPAALGAAVTTLANAMKGASNPDSKVYFGRTPQLITGLVDATRTAAVNTVEATTNLTRPCLSASTRRCAAQRQAVDAALSVLLQATTVWESYR